MNHKEFSRKQDLINNKMWLLYIDMSNYISSKLDNNVRWEVNEGISQNMNRIYTQTRVPVMRADYDKS